MHDLSVRRRMIALASFTAVLGLAACEDKRVKDLKMGMTRDSAVSTLAQETKGNAPDTFPNVYTRKNYLINGKTYEVMYFTPNNEKAGKDSVPLNKLTPIVFVQNQLVGKGWAAWDSISKANNIPLEDHSKK